MSKECGIALDIADLVVVCCAPIAERVVILNDDAIRDVGWVAKSGPILQAVRPQSANFTAVPRVAEFCARMSRNPLAMGERDRPGRRLVLYSPAVPFSYCGVLRVDFAIAT